MMTRVMLLVMMLVPVTAVAQQAGTSAISEGVIVGAPARKAGELLVGTAAQAQTPAARAGSDTRRRPSMVGYIEDSTITTQFRVRFDSSRHIQAPDRSEFFYAKCGCYYSVLPPGHPSYDPDAPGNPDGIMTDANTQQLYVMGEVGLAANRGSLFFELPVRWLKPQAFALGRWGDQSGISDLRFGAKLGLMATDSGQATALLRVTVPTGDPAKGLGTDHVSFEPAFLVGQRVGDRVGIEAQFGAILPTGGSAGIPTAGSDKFSGNVLYYGIGPSLDVYRSDTVRVSPVVELVGWRVMSGFQTGDPGLTSGPAAGFAEASDVSPDIVNIKVGARVVIRDMASIYVGYGHHLTDATWYDDIFRVEYRLLFGR